MSKSVKLTNDTYLSTESIVHNKQKLNELLNNLTSDILKKAYPVGSIYMSVNSTSPATLFGGTWTQLSNRFLVGAGSSYSAGSTGGGTAGTNIKVSANQYALVATEHYSNIAYTGQALITLTKNTGSSSQSLSDNGVKLDPAYLAVYMWKRTA